MYKRYSYLEVAKMPKWHFFPGDDYFLCAAYTINNVPILVIDYNETMMMTLSISKQTADKLPTAFLGTEFLNKPKLKL